jgi:hypothetical protein
VTLEIISNPYTQERRENKNYLLLTARCTGHFRIKGLRKIIGPKKENVRCNDENM